MSGYDNESRASQRWPFSATVNKSWLWRQFLHKRNILGRITHAGSPHELTARFPSKSLDRERRALCPGPAVAAEVLALMQETHKHGVPISFLFVSKPEAGFCVGTSHSLLSLAAFAPCRHRGPAMKALNKIRKNIVQHLVGSGLRCRDCARIFSRTGFARSEQFLHLN